jgi:hypothetical protein
VDGIDSRKPRRQKRLWAFEIPKWQTRSSGGVYRNAFYLALVWAICATLWVDKSNVAHLLVRGSSGQDLSVPELDSFSEPAIAKTILKEHVENLVAAQLEKQESAEAATTQPLEELRDGIQELNTDVHRELMRFYADAGRWNDFLNCYLVLLQEAPTGGEVAYWTHWALVYAAPCNRTDEIVDAIQHVIHFNRDSEVGKHRLAGVLERWQEESRPQKALSPAKTGSEDL